MIYAGYKTTQDTVPRSNPPHTGGEASILITVPSLPLKQVEFGNICSGGSGWGETTTTLFSLLFFYTVYRKVNKHSLQQCGNKKYKQIS